MHFGIQHLATLGKYAGISFIAGAVSHGVFCEERSLISAAFGVLMFLVSAYVENRSQGDGAAPWRDVLGFGILASVGLGFFTGGLQHFPDSPHRSAWVAPLGFFLSLVSVYFGNSAVRPRTKAMLWYALGSGVVVVAASMTASWFFSGASPHGHEHGHEDISFLQPTPPFRNSLFTGEIGSKEIA